MPWTQVSSRVCISPRTCRGAMTWPRRATSVAEAATLLVATPTSTAVFPPPTTTTRLPWMWIGRMGRRGGSVAVERHASERHNAQRLPGTCRGRAMQGGPLPSPLASRQSCVPAPYPGDRSVGEGLGVHHPGPRRRRLLADPALRPVRTVGLVEQPRGHHQVVKPLAALGPAAAKAGRASGRWAARRTGC
jgi:hypothetical protein